MVYLICFVSYLEISSIGVKERQEASVDQDCLPLDCEKLHDYPIKRLILTAELL